MAAEAVGLDLEEEGALPGADILQSFLGDLADIQDIHAVGAVAGNAVAFGFLADLRDGGGAINGGAHAVLVVLADPQDGQLPDLGQVQRLVEITDIGSAIAEHTDRHGVVMLVQVAQRQPGGDRQVRADDGVPAPEILAHIGHVHRAAFAVRGAGGLAEQLGHHHFGGDAAVDGDAVVAVGGDDAVLRAAQRDQAGGDRLLPDVQVQEAADFALLVKLGGRFFQPPDQNHLII